MSALLSVLLLGAGLPHAGSPYGQMAPLSRYLEPSSTVEIRMARDAAPRSISDMAEILVLEQSGYRSAVRGKNGFTCLVQRSWTDDVANPEFWNWKIRVPICFNRAATKSVLPFYLKRTSLVLQGRSRTEIQRLTRAMPSRDPAPGAMAIMMSRNGYLADGIGAAGPHLMFYLRNITPSEMGADLPGSPLSSTAGDTPSTRVFYVGTRKWSDGSAP